MDISALKEAGLTDGEIKVYLALLELGSSTTGPIIEKSGIARSIIYQILEKLMQKGLVSYVTREKTKHFQAAEPYRLLDYLEEEEKKFKKNRDGIKALLPQLLSLKDSEEETEVKVYKGFKGTMTVHEHTYERLKRGEEYYYMGVTSYQPPEQHAYWMKDHQRRAKAGIPTRILFDATTEKKILENRNSYPGCDARYMPEGINTPAWFMGYKNVVAISIPSSKPITIEITNQEIADSFRAYFEDFWSKSRPFNK
ncbi:Sugar-specific transcriptional regulator TrmB [uncultured archaeon]|nr:Sugar-specific transcriptional regulator TrmB [uncultured archaeon]